MVLSKHLAIEHKSIKFEQYKKEYLISPKVTPSDCDDEVSRIIYNSSDNPTKNLTKNVPNISEILWMDQKVSFSDIFKKVKHFNFIKIPRSLRKRFELSEVCD